VDPDRFHADEKTYFRYTRWRSTRAVAQLLANLGASFAADRRIFHPVDPMVIDLDGEWQMKVTLRLAPAQSEAAAYPDPVTWAAKQLVGVDAPGNGWTPVTLPRMIPFFKDNDGEAVFRKEIIVPESAAGKDLILSLGALDDFDDTFVNGVVVGHTETKSGSSRLAPRNYVVPGGLVKAGRNVIAVRLFDRFGEGGFVGNEGPPDPRADRPGPQATGVSTGGPWMYLRPKPEWADSYCPDYRADFPMGDNPYRYYRW
jgi:hypothetical protein